MTTAFFGHTTMNPHTADFLDVDDDFMRYIDIIRLLTWILEMLKKLWGKRRKKPNNVVTALPTSISHDELGYINWNGAY